ncbi:MAG: hypothetical protein ACE5JO_07595, partial [Candidatus Binatia bacterium]
MMAKLYGHCRICDKPGKLSEEHIPPKGAENRGPVKVVKWVEELQRFQEITKHGNGAKVFATCRACNTLSNTGQYDKAYIDFIQQFLQQCSSLAASRNPTVVSFTAKIDRLLFLKRVMFQFLATNQLLLDASRVKALRESILDPAAPVALFGKVFLYAQPDRIDRSTGLFIKNDGKNTFLAQELATYPLGTLWDLLGNLPTQGLYDISLWATVPYGQVEISCALTPCPVTHYLPMESAPSDELDKRREQNVKEVQ